MAAVFRRHFFAPGDVKKLKPVLQAMVLAERIYSDSATGKKVIAGTFNRIQFKKIAVQHEKRPDGSHREMIAGGLNPGCPYLYISLTDICQGTQVIIQFVDLGENKVLLEKELQLECNDRLKTIEIVLPLPMIVPHAAGTYAFQLLCEDEIIGSYRVIAEEGP